MVSVILCYLLLFGETSLCCCWFLNCLRWFLKNYAPMHFTKYTQQLWYIRQQVRDRQAASRGWCNLYILCVLSTRLTSNPHPTLPENSPDLHDLEQWPLRRLKICNSIIMRKSFTNGCWIKVNRLNQFVVAITWTN